MLVDAGLSLKSMLAHLDTIGLCADRVSGIVLTHEHGDHTSSAYSLSRKYGIPLYANRRTLTAVYRGRPETPNTVLESGACAKIGQVKVSTFPVPHDAVEPTGVCVSDDECGHKVTLITDAGHITAEMRYHARKSNLLIVEANHDIHRLSSGPYPGPLKARILSDRGHLSNEAAVGLICHLVADQGPLTVWLAHLSKENNTPKLALGYARATVSVLTGCPLVIDVAKRDKPSAKWTPRSHALQLSLFANAS